jgi:autotransporter-associated beta strand protein
MFRGKAVLAAFVFLGTVPNFAHAVTYYWDNQPGAGFGAAGGTWTDPTANQWSTSTSGADSGLQASVTTTNADSLNFGTATVGLGAGSITVSGTVVADTLTFGAASGNITLSGGVIDATSGSNLAITVNNAQATISSNIIGTPGANTRGINKAGSGMLILSGDNSAYIAGSYTRTFISGGALRIDNALSVPPGLITLQGGVLGLTTATGDFSRTVAYAPNAGTSVQFGTTAGGGFAAYGGDRLVTLNSGGTIQFGVSNNGILGPLMLSHSTADSKVTLTSGLDLNGGAVGGITREIQAGDGSAAIDGEISGVISDTGTTKATLQKTGTGTLALTNNNTYSGATTVSAGTLLISGTGSINSSSSVNIAEGATFLYDSSVAFTAPLTLSANSTIGGTGTLAGDLTISSGSSFNVVNLFDPLVVGGTVDIYAGFGLDDLTGIDWGSIGDGTYTLIDGDLGPGVFDGLDNTPMDLGGGRTAFFQQGSLELVVVPEPGTLALAASALAGLAACRRYRRQRVG